MGRLRDARHRIPENRFWGLLSLQLWVLLVGSDNEFPLHWATTHNNLSNFGERWNHLSIPAGGCGNAQITTLQSYEPNPMSISMKERDPLLVFWGVCSMHVCVCVRWGYSDSLSGNYYARAIATQRRMSSFWNISWIEWVIKEWTLVRVILHWRTMTTLFPIAVTHCRMYTCGHTHARRLTYSMHIHTGEALGQHSRGQSNKTWHKTCCPNNSEKLKGHSTNLVLDLTYS